MDADEENGTFVVEWEAPKEKMGCVRPTRMTESKPMSGQLITIAGAMFIIPLLLMFSFALAGDVPGSLLTIGGWTMAFSLIIGAIWVFIGMNGG